MVIYSSETSEIDSIAKTKHFDSDKNEASELNTNEGESPGSLNIIVEALKIEVTELKSQFDMTELTLTKHIKPYKINRLEDYAMRKKTKITRSYYRKESAAVMHKWKIPTYI